MARALPLCLFMLQAGFVGLVWGQPLPPPHPADSLGSLVDSLIAPHIRPGGPGCAVAVVDDEEIVFERGYGLANLDWGIPNSPTTVFNIASLSKQVTAACVVLLAEDGKLSLDDDLHTWLPEARDYGHRITLRHLLDHTSGIRDYESLMPVAGMRYDLAWEPREVLALILRQQALDFVPGEQYAYSNSGYVLLAEVVRRVSGLTLGQFAQERIFGPLAMANTLYYETLHRVVPDRATGYDRDFDHMIYTAGQTDTYTLGPAGVFTTVEDLARWDRGLYSGRLGGPRFLETMLSRPVLANGDTASYACGLEHGTYRGLPTLSHSGWWAGYLAYMVRFPQERTTVVLLANSTSDILPSRTCYQIADLFLAGHFRPDQPPTPVAPREPPPQAPQAKVDPGLYDPYVGRYQVGNLDAVMTVSRDGPRLLGQFSGQVRFELFPESDSTFFLTIDAVQVRFRRDAGGSVNQVIWYQNGGEMPLERVRPNLSPAELAEYPADYGSDDLQCTWSVVRDGDWLKVRSAALRTVAPSGEELLLRRSGDQFCLADLTVSFVRDGQGRLCGFHLARQGATWQIPFTRQ